MMFDSAVLIWHLWTFMALYPILKTGIVVTYYRHSLGVHLFAFESRVPEGKDKSKLLGELGFTYSCASGLLFDLWVENPSLLGLGHCSHPLFSLDDFPSLTHVGCQEGFACNFCINGR